MVKVSVKIRVRLKCHDFVAVQASDHSVVVPSEQDLQL